MVTAKDTCHGNILFYEILSRRRNPAILHRNLAQATSPEELASKPPGPTFDRARWKPPSYADLNEMIDKNRGREGFVVEIQGIELLQNQGTSAHQRSKKRSILFRLDAEIRVAINNAKASLRCKQYENNVTLLGFDTEAGKKIHVERIYNIFDIEQLLQSGGGLQSPSRGSRSDWKLVIDVVFRRPLESEEFFSHLASSGLRLHTANPASVCVSWDDISDCPDGTTVLPFVSRDMRKQFDFGLKIRMYWQRSKDASPLSTYNRELKAPSSLQVSPYLSPPRTDSPSPSIQSRRYKLQFEFEGLDETKIVHGLSCPFCTKRGFFEIDDLRFHLDAWHSLFKFQARKESIAADGVQFWRLICSVAEHRAEQQRASNAAPDPRDILQMMPRKSFSRQDYLNNGNEEFQKASRFPLWRPAGFLPKRPDDVQDRVTAVKKKYKVPRAPVDKTFFRSITKRPLQEGEEISESDDEPDIDWVRLKHNAHVDAGESGISEAKGRFLRLWDHFFYEEHLNADIHVGDAIIRFARAKHKDLQRAVKLEFEIKLKEMESDNLISGEVAKKALRIVDNLDHATELSSDLANLQVETPRSNPSPVEQADDGMVEARSTGHVTPQTGSNGDVEMVDRPEEPPPYGLCLCGQDALASRGKSIVWCTSKVCVRQVFHIDCINRIWHPSEPPKKRQRGYVCNDCHESN